MAAKTGSQHKGRGRTNSTQHWRTCRDLTIKMGEGNVTFPFAALGVMGFSNDRGERTRNHCSGHWAGRLKLEQVNHPAHDFDCTSMTRGLLKFKKGTIEE